MEALRRLRKNSSDYNVDRRLVTNVVLSFLTTPRADAKRFEMLSLLASILSWNDEEREKAGLQRINATVAPPSSFWRRSSSSTGSGPQAELNKTDETEVSLPKAIDTSILVLMIETHDSRFLACGWNSSSLKPPLARPLPPPQQPVLPNAIPLFPEHPHSEYSPRPVPNKGVWDLALVGPSRRQLRWQAHLICRSRPRERRNRTHDMFLRCRVTVFAILNSYSTLLPSTSRALWTYYWTYPSSMLISKPNG